MSSAYTQLTSREQSGDIIGYGVEVGIALEIQADIDVRTGFTTKIADGTLFNYSPSSGFLDTNL